MGFNNTFMQDMASYATANKLKYGQLHSAAAGTNGTSNIACTPRLALIWTTPTGLGNFGLASAVPFTGGTASGPVYSMTVWTALTLGTFYGEFVLPGGDLTFDASGNYTVTVIDLSGTS
jgi:hypothetical protein